MNDESMPTSWFIAYSRTPCFPRETPGRGLLYRESDQRAGSRIGSEVERAADCGKRGGERDASGHLQQGQQLLAIFWSERPLLLGFEQRARSLESLGGETRAAVGQRVLFRQGAQSL